MKAYSFEGDGRGGGEEVPIPDELADEAQSYREKLMDEVAENSDALMERYLEGEDISHEEIVAALKDGTNHGHIFPVTCGIATRNLGTARLLDAFVEDLPSPVKHGGLELSDELTLEPDADADSFAYVFKTRADPFAGRINLFRVYQGVVHARHATCSTPAPRARSASASCSCSRARTTGHADAFGPGDIGAVAKLKETQGRRLARRPRRVDRDAARSSCRRR